MLDWFQRLMPHTLLFVLLFERHATPVMAAVDGLRQMLDGGEHAAEHCRAVMRYEEEATRSPVQPRRVNRTGLL